MNVNILYARRLIMTLYLLPLSGTAMAHSGHATDGLFGGLTHPLTGFDHLLVMLAVGMWSAAVLRKQAWHSVALFLGFMIAGAVLGISGVALPVLETGIAASVLIMGLLLLVLARVPAWSGMALIALFAVFHGNAHGLEMPSSAATVMFVSGFLMTTGLLHLCGVKLGNLFTVLQREWILRSAGVAVGGILMNDAQLAGELQ